MSYSTNFFTNLPKQFLIPPQTKVCFISDLYSRELAGGAELTTDALIESDTDLKKFRFNSVNITPEILEKNLETHFVFGNYTMLSNEVIDFVLQNNVSYSILEYDFKYCKYRSETLHKIKEKKECDCITLPHGKNIKDFVLKAKNLFFMSVKQREMWEAQIPELKDKKTIILSSVFTKETIEFCTKVKAARPLQNRYPAAAILGEGSWIKGIEQTEKVLAQQNIPYAKLPKMEPQKFLEALSSFQAFAFMPAGEDTCPRVVIEAKLLGCKVFANQNILNAGEVWFEGEYDEMVRYLLERPTVFWNEIKTSL